MSSETCVDLLSRLEEETERQLQWATQSAHNGCIPKSAEKQIAVASTAEEVNSARSNDRQHTTNISNKPARSAQSKGNSQEETASDAKEPVASTTAAHRSLVRESSALEVGAPDSNVVQPHSLGRKRSHGSLDSPENKRRKTDSSPRKRPSVTDQIERDVNVDRPSSPGSKVPKIDTKSNPQLISSQHPMPGARPQARIDDHSGLDKERITPNEIKRRPEKAPDLDPTVSGKQKASDSGEKPNTGMLDKAILETPDSNSGSKSLVIQGEMVNPDSRNPQANNQNAPVSSEQHTVAQTPSERHTEHYETVMLGFEICEALKRAACYSKFDLVALRKRSRGLSEQEYSWFMDEQDIHEVEARDFFDTIDDMSGKSLSTRIMKLLSLRARIETHRQLPASAPHHISNMLTPLRLATMEQDGILRPVTQLRTSSDLLPGLNELVELYKNRVVVDTSFDYLLANIKEDGLGSSSWHKRVEYLMQNQHRAFIASSLRSMLDSLTAPREPIVENTSEALATQQTPDPSSPTNPQQRPEPQVTPLNRSATFNKSDPAQAAYTRIAAHLHRGELDTEMLGILLRVGPTSESRFKKRSNRAKTILGYGGQSNFEVPNMQEAVDKINKVMSARRRAEIRAKDRQKKKTKKEKKMERKMKRQKKQKKIEQRKKAQSNG
ncbi:MAG: hypothetical protein Q9174_002386 [Haloplaca sp. 1 TL-2023]